MQFLSNRARLIGILFGLAVLAYLLLFPQQHSASEVRLWTTAIYIGIAAMGLNLRRLANLGMHVCKQPLSMTSKS